MGSFEEKQIKKRLDQKIERLEIISESEKSELVDSYQDTPVFLDKIVNSLVLPYGLLTIGILSNDYYAASYAKYICMTIDFTGFTLCTMAGIYFGLAAIKYNKNAIKNSIKINENKKYSYCLPTLGLTMTGLYMINSFNVYCYLPFYIIMLQGIFADYVMSGELSGPRYYFLLRLKTTVIINIVLVLIVISVLGKYSHIKKMENYKKELEKKIEDNKENWIKEDMFKNEILEKLKNPKI